MKSTWSMLAAIGLCACTNTSDPLGEYEEVQPASMLSAPATLSAERTKMVEHGRYLVELVGCSVCHTDGAMIGEPRMDRWLAGSRVGIAYSNPLKHTNPGVLFPRNLTPDPDTGLGKWSDEQIATKIRTGVGRHGSAPAPVMPWPSFARLTDEDVGAIVAYLRSLPPVRHKVPKNARPGEKTPEQYVHFGVYRSKR